jgi:hypothetical protein
MRSGARPRIARELANWFDLRREVLGDQRALRRVAVADLRGMDAAGALLFRARLVRRSAASRLSSACCVETVAICAARRSAELGRRLVVDGTDPLTLCLTAIAVSSSISLNTRAAALQRSAIASQIASPTRCPTMFCSCHELQPSRPSLGSADGGGPKPSRGQLGWDASTEPLGKRPGSMGTSPGSMGTGPAVKTSGPRLSPCGAGRAVGGIRAWGENPGRRASSSMTVLRLQAIPSQGLDRHICPQCSAGRRARRADRRVCRLGQRLSR